MSSLFDAWGPAVPRSTAAANEATELRHRLKVVLMSLSKAQFLGQCARLQEEEGMVSYNVVATPSKYTLLVQDVSGDDNDNICHICLTDFMLRDKVTVLPCSHRFHASCIERWFTVKHMCPLCRISISTYVLTHRNLRRKHVHGMVAVRSTSSRGIPAVNNNNNRTQLPLQVLAQQPPLDEIIDVDILDLLLPPAASPLLERQNALDTFIEDMMV